MKKTIARTMDGSLRLSLIVDQLPGKRLVYYLLERNEITQGHYDTKRAGLRAYRTLWQTHPMSDYERGLRTEKKGKV
jgi:hypothetical protein